MRAALAIGLWIVASAAVAEVELVEVAHRVNAAEALRVRCASDGAVWLEAGGRALRRAPGGTRFEPARRAAFPASADAEPATTAPVRDRLMWTEGLRSRHVYGARGALAWYGRAATGVSVPDGQRWRDLLTDRYVRDADVDRAGAFWALTDAGLFSGPLGGGEPARAVEVPREVPGNALDGAFLKDGALHVFGPAGLHRLDGEAWTALIEGPVLDARLTPRGDLAALTATELWSWPGPRREPLAVPYARAFALDAAERLHIAAATELRTVERHATAVSSVRLSAAPLALTVAPGALALALTGPEGGLLVLHDAVAEPQRIEVSARCFHAEPGRLLIGTDEGLASLEGDRLHWYFHRPGLSVTAVTAVGPLHVLATSAGVLALDGPAVAARLPLEAHVTALVPEGDGIWAATADQGLYRLRLLQPPAAPAPVTQPPPPDHPAPPVRPDR